MPAVLLHGLSGGTTAILATVGAALLIAASLLRPARRTLVVAFVGLWSPAASRRLADRLARRLRRWLSLLLQLTILALLLLAAADVTFSPAAVAGRTVVLLVDRSASMQALDEPGSRLERARTLAHGIVDGLVPEDRALVASFGAAVSTLTGMENDRARLHAAVAAVVASDEAGDLPAAMLFAAEVLRGQPRPTVVMVSDGAGLPPGAPAALAAVHGVDFTFLPVGRRGDNVGLVAFSGRRLAADPSTAELALVTQNFRPTPCEVTVAITAGPLRIPVARQRLLLQATARATTTLTDVTLPDGQLQATIEDAHDDFPLDDHAYAVVPAAPPLSLLVVGDRNLYLDGALLGMAGSVRIERAPAMDADASWARWATYDVVIFDGVTPRRAPDAGRYLYLDPHGQGSPWAERGTIRDPVVTDVLHAHALMKQVSLSDLNVARARRLSLQSDDVAVAGAAGDALIVARSRRALREVALAFDPRQSDLPLRSAFPLFLANAVGWLAQQPPPPGLSWPTGRTVRIDMASRSSGYTADQAVDIRIPGGAVRRVPVVEGAITLALDRVGLFTVTTSAGHELFQVAANLASPAESDTTPRATLRAGDQQWRRGPTNIPRRSARPIWQLALAAAVLLAACEWITFHRRLTV